MAEIKYIHAADLHLDTPFTGLMRDNNFNRLGKLLKEATFTALDRLVQLCASQKPDFLVLAGDIYNGENASVKAQLKLKDACVRLDDLGIPVYIVHGNHDPLSSKFQSLKFPDNVHVFSADNPEIVEFNSPDGKRALIHGISHGQSREGRNLATLFKRKMDDNSFQLGLLHCSVENAYKGDRYAPCTLNDLKNTGLDAWALGHVHEGGVLSDQPFIAYSGNTQGLHINETGSRGCLLVKARGDGGHWRCEPEFHTLGPIQWKKLTLNMDQATEPAELETRLSKIVEEEQRQAEPASTMLINRLIINGKTALNGWLRQDGRIEDLQSIIDQNSTSRPTLWLKDVEIFTRDELDWEQSMAREDLLGETIRVYTKLVQNSEQLKEGFEKALKPLLSRPQLARIFQNTNEAEIKEILYQAENICMDILEKR